MNIEISKKRISKVFVVIVVFVCGVIEGYAQTAQVNIMAAAKENEILIRIAPGSPALWELGNKYGYIVERYTVTRGNQYLGNKERKILTPSALKPLPLTQWEPLANTNELAEITAEAIYGETFELATDFDQDIMQVYTKAKELESRFSFALFCADISREVAQASGLYLNDTDVKKGERYLYRVYTTVPQNLIASDTGFVYVNLDDYAPLPEIKDVKVQFADKLAMISWNTRYAQSFYSAYWVERSEDGNTFKRITELPYVNTVPENVQDPGVAFKIDSLAENNKTYFYRVIGLSPFGETSKPSEAVKGEGIEELGAAPAIRKVVSIENQALVQWEFSTDKEQSIKGFEIIRSHQTDVGYKTISGLLPPTARSFTDKQPEGTNYYKVKAIGKGNQLSFSFPSLYQVEDSIPPSAPAGLIGVIDTAGVVTLRWNKNMENDLYGYRVYRSNFKSAEFSQITNSPVEQPQFNETISLQNLTKEVYYKVQAIDNRFNPSGFSTVVKLVKPDVVPPIAPVITKWKATKDSMFVAWTPSASADVARYNLKHKRKEETEWSTKTTIFPGQNLSHQFKDLKAGRYEFCIEVLDSASNSSTSKILQANIVGGTRKGIENVKAVADRANKQIVLTWKNGETDVAKVLIYRGENNTAPTLYKSLLEKSNEFVDSQVVINTSYRYHLKVIYINGEESGFSKEVGVKY